MKRKKFPRQLYTRVNSADIILRDMLALDRTILANERTFLSYIRTALTFFGAGITFIQFFGHPIIIVVGWVFVPTGVVILVIGSVRFQRQRTAFAHLEDDKPPSGSGE